MTDGSENRCHDIASDAQTQPNPARQAERLPPVPEGSERILIWPHRSLDRDGMLIVVAIAAIGLAIVTGWVAAPANWFVLVPAIVALASLAFALWLNTRRATRVEVVDVGADAIQVMTSYLGRHELVGRFNPYWARIELSDAFKIDKRLILSESGRAVSIGDCLSAVERENLAEDLRARIKRLTATS